MDRSKKRSSEFMSNWLSKSSKLDPKGTLATESSDNVNEGTGTALEVIISSSPNRNPSPIPSGSNQIPTAKATVHLEEKQVSEGPGYVEGEQVTKTLADRDEVDKDEGPYQAAIPPSQIQKGRRLNFQQKWFQEFPWLHYLVGTDGVVCYVCMKAKTKNLFNPGTKLEDSFISAGFKNWKKAIERFKIHQNGQAHLEAVLKLDSTHRLPIELALKLTSKETQVNNRRALNAIFTTIKFLGRQGLPLLGHEHNQGNFMELLRLRSSEIPILRPWLEKTKSFTSAEIQNEICELFAHRILRNICKEVQSSTYFSTIVDETTDISTTEQVSICLRYINNATFMPEERFLGLYSTDSTTGESLANIIEDSLKRFALPLRNLRGQCYDGAANMKGSVQGVQSRIRQLEPRALYVHCFNHSLNLALQDAAKQFPPIRDILQYVHDISILIGRSPKRLALFNELNEEPGITKLRPLCPTRWTVRCASIKTLLSNFEATIKTLLNLSNSRDSCSTKAAGLLHQIEKGDSVLLLLVCRNVFQPCELLSVKMQKEGIVLGECVEEAKLVVEQLNSMKSVEGFEELWTEMNKMVLKHDLEPAVLPRLKKVPRRYQNSGSKALSHPQVESVHDHFFNLYGKVIDVLVFEITQRFQQESVDEILELEKMITKDDYNFASELCERLCGKFDLDASDIKLQVSMFRKLEPVILSSAQCHSFLADRHSAVKGLFPELRKLLELLLVIPSSTAIAERSFSMLRRVKSYLRSTMGQARLNHLSIMHVYQDEIDSLDIDSLMDEFVSRNSYRELQFGKSK